MWLGWKRPFEKYQDNIKMDLREIGCDDGRGSRSCSVARFGVRGVELSGSATMFFLESKSSFLRDTSSLLI
jgi:hypothetical protein